MKKIAFIFIFISVLLAQTKMKIEIDSITQDAPYGITKQTAVNFPKIALVLSGGGSRGISEIGVLKAFQENNIPINFIVGTSMGSIIGGLYSAGVSLDELKKIAADEKWKEFQQANDFNRKDLFVDQKVTEDKAFLTIRFNHLKPIIPTSINAGNKISTFLNLATMKAPLNFESDFSKLFIPFQAVSTNLIKGSPVILKKGRLSEAIRASSSVSLLLPPVKIDSLLLADGGLVSNVPVRIAKKLNPDIIVAVNVTSPLRTKKDLNFPWNIADQIISIPISVINKEDLKEADIVITPDMGNVQGTDFNNIDWLISQGYIEGQKYISEIEKIIKQNFIENNLHYNFDIKNPRLTTNDKNVENIFKSYLRISNKINLAEFYFDLTKLFNSGEYKSIKINIDLYSDFSSLNILTSKTSIINNINLTKDSNEFVKTKLLKMLKGNRYNSYLLTRSFNEIINHYRDSGNLLATIKQTSFKNNILSVEFDEGKIDSIKVYGGENTASTVVSREFAFSKFKPFLLSDAEKTLLNITSSNLFDNVELQIVKEKNLNILNIHLAEKIPTVFRLGARLDNEYHSQLAFDFRNENIFGTGTELGIIFSTGIQNRSLVIEHKANRIFDTYLTYKIRAYHGFKDIKVYDYVQTNIINEFNREEKAKYRQVKSGLSIGIGSQFKRLGNLIFEGRFENNKIINKNNFELNSENFNYTAFKLSLMIDSQNKYPFPTKGVFINTYYETAQAILGTKLSYSKFSFKYRNYFTFNEYHTIGTRFTLGFADKTLPISQQFSFGGQDSFFGFRENEFRGKQIFISSLEYRFRIPVKFITDIYLKLRYDLGSSWIERETIKFKNLKHGIGATISLNTPIGPADFSVGRSFVIADKLKNNKIIYGPVFFYFTIGYYY